VYYYIPMFSIMGIDFSFNATSTPSVHIRIEYILIYEHQIWIHLKHV